MATVLGCMLGVEQRDDARIFEMQDHELDGLAAVEALIQQDRSALRAAGKRLAQADPVPGLPVEAKPMLDATRSAGTALVEANTFGAAADALADLADSCAACHGQLGITPHANPAGTKAQEAWLAVALPDEARWKAATSKPWQDRHAALAPILLGGAP